MSKNQQRTLAFVGVFVFDVVCLTSYAKAPRALSFFNTLESESLQGWNAASPARLLNPISFFGTCNMSVSIRTVSIF